MTGDLANLPFGDGQFDQVLSQLALESVPNTDRAFQEVFRVTKPGGEFAAGAWDARGGLMFNRIFLDTASVLDDEAGALRKAICTRPLRRPTHLESAMRSAGFTDIHSGELVIRTVFDSFDDYWAPFEGTDGPIPVYFSKRPARLKAEIKDAVRRAYLDGEDDGPRSYVAAARAASSRRPV